MDEHLTITWAEFQKNVETSFGEVKFTEDFADVTLVGEDYEVEAHRGTPQAAIFFNGSSKRRDIRIPCST